MNAISSKVVTDSSSPANAGNIFGTLYVCVCTCRRARAHVCISESANLYIILTSSLMVTAHLSNLISFQSPHLAHSVLGTCAFFLSLQHMKLILAWGLYNSYSPQVRCYPSDLPSPGGLLLVGKVLFKCHIPRDALSYHPTKQPSNNLLLNHPALIPSVATTIRCLFTH